MPRVKIDLPPTFSFVTDIPLYSSHINASGHLDNAQLFFLVSEARERFLLDLGYTSTNIEGLSIILADAAVQYITEAFYGEVMRVAMTATDFNKRGCDFVYQVTDAATGREVARGKSGVVFFDYTARKVGEVPPPFKARFD